MLMAVLGMLETEVMRLWSEILGVEVSSAHQDFFELGGQSLAMVQFLAMVESEFQVELPVEVLFADGLTVAEAARAIEESRTPAVTGEPS
jgi:acyl carrier protein